MKMKKKIIGLLIAIMAMLQVLPSMAQNIQQTPADKLFAQYREQYSQEAQVFTLDKSGIKDVYNSEEAKKAEFFINHTQSANVLVFSNPKAELVSTVQRDLNELAKQGYTKNPAEEASCYLVKGDKIVEQVGLEKEGGSVMIILTKCDFPKDEFEDLNSMDSEEQIPASQNELDQEIKNGNFPNNYSSAMVKECLVAYNCGEILNNMVAEQMGSDIPCKENTIWKFVSALSKKNKMACFVMAIWPLLYESYQNHYEGTVLNPSLKVVLKKLVAIYCKADPALKSYKDFPKYFTIDDQGNVTLNEPDNWSDSDYQETLYKTLVNAIE